MVSLKDIATELNLSVGLVSKVLSGRMGTTGVSADKRNRILSVAQARGFAPNRIARALRSGRVGTIGLFLHPSGERGSEISESFLRGFAHRLASTPYHLWLTFFEFDLDVHRVIVPHEIRRQVDALVVAGVPHRQLIPSLEEFDQTGLPVIMSAETVDVGKLANISVDGHLQGRLPTEHLLSRGCRHIAEISFAQQRHRGCLDALNAAGLANEDLLVQAGGYGIEDGRSGVRRLLDRGVLFDGLVCHSDQQALGALFELQSRGIRVPEQVKLIGVDDGALCEFSPIPLSSVTSESRQLGVEAVEAVLRRLDGEEVKSRTISPQVVVRASTSNSQWIQ